MKNVNLYIQEEVFHLKGIQQETGDNLLRPSLSRECKFIVKYIFWFLLNRI